MSDAYYEGRTAFFENQDFWQNPYSSGSSSTRAFHAWFAGWCNAKLTHHNEQKNSAHSDVDAADN